jgi:opacity protein-like surface antigen
MQRACVRFATICLAVLGVAASASAQSAPRTEISGGYQFLTFDIDGENESMPKGWYFDVAGNLNPMFGIVFQVGGNYKSFGESVTVGGGTFAAEADLKVHEFLGGLRVSARNNPRLVPYGQLLVGGVNASLELTATSTIPGIPGFSTEDSGTNFALEAGGGVNFGVAENTGIRFGVDYLRTFADDDGANAFRFHVGVVFSR